MTCHLQQAPYAATGRVDTQEETLLYLPERTPGRSLLLGSLGSQQLGQRGKADGALVLRVTN